MDKPCNVFISWSGERSRWVAEALQDWLPKVIQTARPWMSDKDVKKGSRGLHEIAKALDGISVGISCLTPENLREPWILYEAGALSKTINDETRLCTYLCGGLEPHNIEPPLGMFQHTKAEKEDTGRLVLDINSALSHDPVPESNLREIFEAMWPKLDEKLKSMPVAGEKAQVKRSTDEMLAEILDISRAEANRRRKTDALDEFLPIFEEIVPIIPYFLDSVRAFRNQVLGSQLLGAAAILGGKVKPSGTGTATGDWIGPEGPKSG